MLKIRTHNKAQALIELAVFGAVVIFLIGILVRQGVTSTQSENMKLKAMRRAMALSLLSSGNGPNRNIAGLAQLANELLPSSPLQPAARNSGSVLFIEDRLSTEFNKVGSISRVPIIAQGGATFSNNLYRPLDWGGEGAQRGNINEINSLPITDLYVNGQHIALKTGAFVIKDAPADGCYWETIPSNSKDFCITESSCPSARADTTTAKCQGLTLQERFDLNRNGDFSDDPPPDRYHLMTWQWNAVEASDVDVDCENGGYPSYDIDGDGREEVIYGLPGTQVCGGSGLSNDKIAVLDFQDGDIDYSTPSDKYLSPKIAPGLKQESDIFTLTNNGTFLRIKEGKAYNPETGDYVRNITNKDQVDIVSRLFILSNNTGHVCGWKYSAPDANGNRTRLDRPAPGTGRNLGDIQNGQGIEACNDCFSQSNIGKTCMGEVEYEVEVEGVTKSVKVPAIFIRSRVYNKDGKKWFTEFTSDPSTGLKRTELGDI